jgi:TorA maturation chaperone TorD
MSNSITMYGADWCSELLRGFRTADSIDFYAAVASFW